MHQVASLVDAIGVAVALVADGHFVCANRAFADKLGSDLVGHAWLDAFAAADRVGLVAAYDDALAGRSSRRRVHLVFGDATVEVALARTELGASLAVAVTVQDEQRTDQAQKMEAVGQLAGGIAHDFNNILAVVMSNCELALDAIEPDHPVVATLLEIDSAAKRAADLTRQLLAFSRKQHRLPKPLALNAIVTGIEAMLSRLVGEDIAMSAVLAPQLGIVEADAGQLEQVLMNLVINARDAMPRGGRLAIETANAEVDDALARELRVPPGRYATISVTDSGCGMPDSVLARVFEPFFTTKDVGKGTGLGLSTVFGIVQQSGGAISVASEVGRGSTFRVYLPRVDAPAVVPGAPAGRSKLARGSGTVLLVEDDDQVRSAVRRYLSSWGYTVREAANAAAALELVSAADPVDVLLTDIVMPGMDGHTLARQLVGEHPGVRVIFMSGYTDHPALQVDALEVEDMFLLKPFSAKDLSQMLQRACARGPRRRTTGSYSPNALRA
jgi:two-component system cell cycle sensor histidine kinase/response regulator CckA